MTEYDSFISHRHMAHDLAWLQQIGLDAYRAELEEKIKILHTLLDGYNDGRRKPFIVQPSHCWIWMPFAM